MARAYEGTEGKWEVTIEYSGNRTTDFKLANEAAGFKKKPKKYTWHHVEDGKTMQLIETDVHMKFPHTGGFSESTNK